MQAPQKFTVALDSCVFFKDDFWQLSLEAFSRLLVLYDAGIVQILLVDIVRREAKSVIIRKSAAIWEAHKVHCAIFGETCRSAGEVESHLIAEFEKFCEKTQAVETDHLTAGRIFDLYWNQRPPFRNRKKRNEFPDAFSLVALTDWAERHGEIRVVSDDPDWRDSCDGALKYHKTVESLLAHILEKSGDALWLSRLAVALKGALLDAGEIIAAQISLDSTTTFRREGVGPLKASDIVSYEYDNVRVLRVNDLSIFSVPEAGSVDPQRVSATVELSFTCRFSCEIENPEAEEDPTAPPTREFVTRFEKSREFNVQALYDPMDSTCRITGLYPYGEYGLAFLLRLRGERWVLVEDAPGPDAA